MLVRGRGSRYITIMTSKTQTLKIALAQLNPIVGDLSGNAELLKQARADAAASGADIVVASELFLTGYPPEDLVLKRSFLTRAREMVDDLVALTADGGPALIFGAPMIDGGQLHNSVVAADGGQMAVRHKHHLPNYAVFDEKRLFHAGPLPAPVEMRGVRIRLADLRGYLVWRCVRAFEGRRRRASGVAQRVAIRARQT